MPCFSKRVDWRKIYADTGYIGFQLLLGGEGNCRPDNVVVHLREADDGIADGGRSMGNGIVMAASTW